MLRKASIVLLSAFCVAACAAVQPALKTLAIAFGQDLIASASVNYTPRYAEQVESLLVALAREGTGLDVEPQLTASGYRPPPRDYETYGNTANVEYAEDEYADLIPYEEDYDDGYPAGTGSGLALDAAILVQRAGSATLETIRDGDVLRDGGDDPARGDLLQFYFRSNREAWVYVIGIDATGYVAQIFPDTSGGPGNPVAADREYVTPPGNQRWGLDSQAGVEQVYFVASEFPRDDIEQVINGLLTQPRQISTNQYRPVRRPAVVRTRGLVKVGSPGNGQMTKAVPASDTWYAPEASSEVVLTRWFVHESVL